MAGGRKNTAYPNEIEKLGEPSDFDVLAYVLGQLDPKADARALADTLLERFGRLCDVLDASPELLSEVPGIKPRVAALLTSYPVVFRQYQESRNRARTRIWDTAMAYQLVRSKFFSRKSEIVVLQILDSKSCMRYMGIVAYGNMHSAPLYIREIIRLCLAYEASAVYLSHNHPSGNCTPSASDIAVTKEIALALSGIEVSLADHFIFTDEDFLSMRESGILKTLRNEIAAMKKQLTAPGGI